MVLGYLASSWNSLRTGRKTESQASQQSHDETAEDLGTDKKTFASEDSTTSVPQDTMMAGNKHAQQQFDAVQTSRSPSSSKKLRKNKQRKRKRRSSIDTSILAPESDSGDLASIPYRADEQAERDAFVTDNESASHENQSNGKVEYPTLQDPTDSLTPSHRDGATSTEHVLASEERTNKSEVSIVNQDRQSPRPRLVENGSRNRYPCPGADLYNCHKTFNMLSAARRHMESAHSQQLQCPDCNQTFSDPDRMQQHQLAHNNGVLSTTESKSDTRHDVDEPIETHRLTDTVGKRSPLKDVRAKPSNGSFISINIDVDMDGEDGIPSNEADPLSTSPQAQRLSKPDIVHNTKAESGMKRKRNRASSAIPTPTSQPQKKRKTDLLSPPTSVVSETPKPYLDSNDVTKASSSKVKKQMSGNLNGFAKPWLPGSQLYHPSFNPRSPRKGSNDHQVLIPKSSQAGPDHESSENMIINMMEDTPLAAKTQKSSAYTSAKGKQRADPDIEYTSPVQKHSQQAASLGRGSTDETGSATRKRKRSGMATSVARRSSLNGVRSSPASSEHEANHESDASGDQLSSDGNEDAEPMISNGDVYLCQECHRKFPSLESLRKHESRADAHKLIALCNDCNRTFASRKMLQQHQRDEGHGDGTGYSGRKGPFSASEISKLLRWRERFCQEYDINRVDFNNMMTDSLRRQKGFIWPYRFITKAEFLQEYHDVLPGRNRRSMHRYRERAFQNVSSNLEWTQEDDLELANLYNEVGPKWVEIGQRMGRTSDAVNQRWRNKVQYHGKQNDGEWLKDETQQLIKAVNQVRRESGMSLDPQADVKMPWDSVSKKLKGKRTAQQCSNKWRLLYTVRKKGVFIKDDGATSSRSNSGTPLPAATPSKIVQRLAGKTPSKSTKKSRVEQPSKSTKYVHDSDDESLVADKGPESELGAVSAPGIDVDAENDAEPGSDADVTSDMNIDKRGSNEDTSDSDHNGEMMKESSVAESGQEAQHSSNDVDNEGENDPTDMNPIQDIDMQPPDATSSSGRSDGGLEDLSTTSEQVGPAAATQADENQSSSGHDSVQLPRNPLLARTPRNDATLSQTFNQTQANTSALRAPRTGSRNNSQSTRPSPHVPIRARPTLTPTSGSQELYHGSQINDHGASSTSSSADSEDSESESSSDDSDNDTMVQDTRKESFLQSLRQNTSSNSGHGSSQASRKVDWAKRLSGQADASDDSSSGDGDDNDNDD